MGRPRTVTNALAAAALALAGCATTTTSTSAPAAPVTHHRRAKHKQHAARARRHTRKAPSVTGKTGTAMAALDRLAVKGRAPKTGYSRLQFGDGWADVGGCDTRDRILTRDLADRQYEDSCRVTSGVLADPYTAQRITYTRGASDVDIDHVVALSDAWQKGAQQWSAETREAFANDPLELLAVDEHANRSKGDGDAATWLPANKPFRCPYVARQVAVKTKYRLWVTDAEKDAIARVLSTCPGQKLPSAGAHVNVTPTPTSASAPDSTTVSTAAAPSESRSRKGQVFANCTAARAAGAAPMYRGTPDYAVNQDLDRDHDGVACES